MADAVKTVGQNMDQEAADELICAQVHCLLAVTILDPIIFPLERNCVGIGADEAAV